MDRQSEEDFKQSAARLTEWYGWHFPELRSIVADPLLYARVVRAIGMRTCFCERGGLLPGVPEEIAACVRDAAATSMGTDISEEDYARIQALADTVISMGNALQEHSDGSDVEVTTTVESGSEDCCQDARVLAHERALAAGVVKVEHGEPRP